MKSKSLKHAAVIPAQGIGDALLMMIASHHLLNQGWEVTCYHPHIHTLKEWFDPRYRFSPLPIDLEEFSSCSLILVQNDNSILVKRLKEFPQTAVFYPTYSPQKHGPLSAQDYAFNPTLPMAQNIKTAVRALSNTSEGDEGNGLMPPSNLVHQLHKKRIVIHPLSSDERKNWSRANYLVLADLLHQHGFETAFVTSQAEQHLFPEARAFSTLNELARFVYESGFMIGNDSLLGHLASHLNIPTLIIADSAKRMQLWRPGYRLGEVITPSALIPNFKGLRWREKHWQQWIRPKQVLRKFLKLH